MTPTDANLASTKALDDLRAINARFIENFINNDVAAHDALLHPAFIGIRSDGARVGRADYLKAWARGFDPAFIVHFGRLGQVDFAAGLKFLGKYPLTP